MYTIRAYSKVIKVIIYYEKVQNKNGYWQHFFTKTYVTKTTVVYQIPCNGEGIKKSTYIGHVTTFLSKALAYHLSEKRGINIYPKYTTPFLIFNFRQSLAHNTTVLCHRKKMITNLGGPLHWKKSTHYQ